MTLEELYAILTLLRARNGVFGSTDIETKAKKAFPAFETFVNSTELRRETIKKMIGCVVEVHPLSDGYRPEGDPRSLLYVPMPEYGVSLRMRGPPIGESDYEEPS